MRLHWSKECWECWTVMAFWILLIDQVGLCWSMLIDASVNVPLVTLQHLACYCCHLISKLWWNVLVFLSSSLWQQTLPTTPTDRSARYRLSLPKNRQVVIDWRHDTVPIHFVMLLWLVPVQFCASFRANIQTQLQASRSYAVHGSHKILLWQRFRTLRASSGGGCTLCLTFAYFAFLSTYTIVALRLSCVSSWKTKWASNLYLMSPRCGRPVASLSIPV